MQSTASQSPPAKREGDSMLGRVLDGRYRIEAEVGEGGLGSVYRAHHLKLARPVAVKVLKSELRGVPEIRKRFEREVRALSSLSHPNIITITDYGVADGLPYLVMELAEGVELNKMVKDDLEPERAIEIVRQILGTLTYAHARDVIHRDLKPANVIVRKLPDGRDHATVLDFGLAKFVGDGESAAVDLTRSGLVVGTPAYMPPEHLASGARKADARADLYAAGLILFELLAGRRPFLHEESTDLLRAHLLEPPPTLAEAMPGAVVTPELEALVARALAKTPADRWQSATEMIAALDALPANALVKQGAPKRSTPKRRGDDATKPSRPTPISQMGAESVAALVARRKRDQRQRWLAGLALAAVASVVIALAVVHGRPAADPVTSTAASHGEPSTPPPTAADIMGTIASASEGVTDAVGAVAAQATAAAEPSAEVPEGAEPAAIEGPTLEAASEEPLVIEPASEEPLDPELAELESAEPDPGTGEEIVEVVVPAERPRSRNPWRGSVPQPLRRYLTRVQRGDELSRSELHVLTRYRNQHPRDPRGRLLLGHAFAARGWLTAALIQYQSACAIDLGIRGDPLLLENLTRMARTETLAITAGDAIVRVYGAEARGEVERMLARSSGEDAARLRALLARLGD